MTGSAVPIFGHAGRSKTAATWLALVGGSLGLHRFYLHGWRDRVGWLFPLPTLVGLYGALRMRALGGDDQIAWLLIPLVGVTLTASMLSAIVYGLTSDARWNERFRGDPDHPRSSGWGNVIGVILALAVGATLGISSIVFTAQRYFEFQHIRAAGR
jgi:hypothetical protein